MSRALVEKPSVDLDCTASRERFKLNDCCKLTEVYIIYGIAGIARHAEKKVYIYNVPNSGFIEELDSDVRTVAIKL